VNVITVGTNEVPRKINEILTFSGGIKFRYLELKNENGENNQLTNTPHAASQPILISWGAQWQSAKKPTQWS